MKDYSLGLIGYPLSHSLSPPIHQAALDGLGLGGKYHLYTISPLPEGADGLTNLLQMVRGGEIHGLNVTIPHKENILALLDEVTPAAKVIGAVNTIYLQDGLLCGDNTDAPGFWGDVEPLVKDGVTRTALVLGAGGSARAVVYALLANGYRVTIAARRAAQAQALCAQFPDFNEQSTAIDWQDLTIDSTRLHANSSLIVNTTPVGMYPKVDASPWPLDIPLPPGAAVYDLVYNPPQTQFIRQASQVGLPARNGMGMLVEQAALAFERWTGLDAPRERMAAAVNIPQSSKDPS